MSANNKSKTIKQTISFSFLDYYKYNTSELRWEQRDMEKVCSVFTIKEAWEVVLQNETARKRQQA